MATTSYAQGATGSKGVQLNPAPAPAAQQPTFTAFIQTLLSTATLNNNTAGAIDLASSTWYVQARKRI